MAPRTRSLLVVAGHACRLGLSFVFLSAGALKALDPQGFTHEVSQYGIVPEGLCGPFAWFLITLEVAVGVALLLNFRTAWSFGVSAGLLVMFIGALGFAIVTDQPLQECGCFGRSTPRSPEESLTEDLGFLAACLFGWFALSGSRDSGGGDVRWKGPVVAAVAVASGAFALASPHLPIDDLATALRPGVAWESLGVALAEVDLTEGAWFVGLLGMKDEASFAEVGALNAMAGEGRIVPLGLYGDDDADYNEFFWTRGPAFPLYHIAPTDMRRLHRRLPRFFAVKEGIVTATWVKMPTQAQVADALR